MTVKDYNFCKWAILNLYFISLLEVIIWVKKQ